MKKFIALFMAAVFLWPLASAAANTPGGSSDPLVSRSYVDETFVPEAVKTAGEEGFSALESEFAAASRSVQSGIPAGYSFASGYVPVTVETGEQLSLRFGSSVILTGGSAHIEIAYGAVVNVATGQETATGSLIAADQRYFCCEDAEVTIIPEGKAELLVSGDFAVSGEKSFAARYSDVSEGSWYYEYVRFVVENGLYYDIEGETFRPNEDTTRATLVYALWSASDRPEPEGESPFTDVEGSEWHGKAVVWASENGIVLGYDDDTFRPEVTVSREQIAALIHRYIGFLGRDDSARAELDRFGDANEIASWFNEDFRWAVADGVFIGNDEAQLEPKKTATRAEVATMLKRIIEN